MSSVDIRRVTRTAILIALTVAFQSLGLQQMVTGPVVNMFLYLAVMTVGIWGGVVTGLITPAVALWVGILKSAMAPMVPLSHSETRSSSPLRADLRHRMSHVRNVRMIGVLIGSLVKFLILSATVSFHLVQVPGPLAQRMGEHSWRRR